MELVKKLLVFVASPGDVPTERRYVEEVVNEINHSVASDKGIVLQVVRWENDSFPGYGLDAQALINAQIADMAKYSLFVGIMWNRLGKPTPRASSGTVEEFERAVEAYGQAGQPDIWFYFRKSPTNLNTEEQLEQRRKVLAFQKQVEEKGMPWPYKNPKEFRDKFRVQLINWLNKRSSKTQQVEPPTKANRDLINQVQSSFSIFERYLNRYSTDQGWYFRGVLQPLEDELGSRGGSPVKQEFTGRTIEALLFDLIGGSSGKQAEIAKNLKRVWAQLLQLEHTDADDNMSQRGQLISEARSLLDEAKVLISELE